MTPTLKQIWQQVCQLQKEMKQLKTQISEERELRFKLQNDLMTHIKASCGRTTANP